MSQPAVHPPDLTRKALPVVRALTIGLRASNLYPPEHPALGLAIDRLKAAVAAATAEGSLMIAVTPHTLIIDGASIDTPDTIVAECARVLHDLDILQLAFIGASPDEALHGLLDTLTLERSERRKRGGPAAIWAEAGHPSIVVEQIDYQELLEREGEEGIARRDVLWKSIVRSIVAGRRTFTEAEQKRLLEISGDSLAIGELADDCRGAYCNADGSPLVTTQAATVLAVYRHIAATVNVLEPERAAEVMGHFTVATSSLEPTLAFEVLAMQDAAADPAPIMAALKRTFDEHQVAMLLARALAKAGQATNRLSQILDTMAPDEDRRRRVLRLAGKLLSERDFGSQRPLTDIRNSLEELMLKYDETPFVSAEYRASMDTAAGRAAELAARDLPPEITEWLETLGHENVRDLSSQLLIDLLNIETSPERAAEIASDIGTFAQDLILSGAYGEAKRVVDTLRTVALKKPPIAPEACNKAIESVGRSHALSDSIGLLGEVNAEDAAVIGGLCHSVGSGSVRALVTGFGKEEGGLQSERAAKILASLGPGALPEITLAIDDARKWFVQRQLAQVLGTIGTAAAVPALQTLLRRGDARVLNAVVPALSNIEDPSAARALQTVLRSARGTARDSVVQTLVGMRDARVVPMLARILDESDALGADFDVVLDTLDVIASFKDNRAVRPITGVARQRRWLAWGKTRALRQRALAALVDTGTPDARAALHALVQTGDWQLQRLARAALAGERT